MNKNKKINIEDSGTNKMKKVLKISVIVAAIILIVEAVIFGFMWYQNKQKEVFYDANSMIVQDESYNVVVGSTDFKYSKTIAYTNGVEKAKISKYKENGELIFEKSFDEGFRSMFSAVVAVDDGYIAAGSAEFTEYQNTNNIREAILVKYDKDGNKVWVQRYNTLSNSKFLDILVEEDGVVVVGQSIYENLELGNHTTGGGIIVKYDFSGKLIWASNYGGNKSGIFRDVEKVNGGFVTVGRDSKDTGMIVFFDDSGERKWQRNYSYTDSEGFQSVVASGNDLYVVGSKKIWTDTGNEEVDNQRDSKNTEALLVKYDIFGKMYFEKSFGGSNYERYQRVYLKDGFLYMVGHLTSTDTDLKVSTKNKEMTGLIVKSTLEGSIVKKTIYGGSNDDNLLYLTYNDNSFLAVGLSNSNDGHFKGIKSNGRDYRGFIVSFDEELNIK